MNRWEKLSVVLLRLVDSARGTQGAIAHVSGQVGRMCDTLARIEALCESTNASHQKTIRFDAEIDARVSKLERASANGA